MASITNTRFPTSPFIEPATGRPSREWIVWLQSPQFVTLNLSVALAINSGGTGLNTLPTNGQLLIGNNNAYSLNTLTAGTGISVTNGPGTITIANTGVLSFSAGVTGLTPNTPTTGAVVLGGVLNAASGGTGQSSYTVGDLLFASATTALSKLPDVATGNALISGGVGVAPSYGKIGLTTHVSGTLPVANGGTGATTLTGVVKGNGTSPFTAGTVNLATEVTGTLPVANGGTGDTTYTNGQLLIGNTTGNTLTKATLTAGSNIAITNGTGSIAIATTGATGSFTSADIPPLTVTVVDGIITSIV